MRRRTLVLATALVLLAGGLVWGWHWRTHPEVFPGSGASMEVTFDGERRSIYLGLTHPYPGKGERVTIESVSPHSVRNTAGATFAFYVCHLDLRDVSYDAIGTTGPRDLARVCADPVPVVDGTELDVGADPPQQLIMEVTVQKRGVVDVRGARLTYSHGWQHGTQTIGEHLKINAR